jgi:hypothetical protein
MLGRRKNKNQDPSWLANLLIGDLNITGELRIEVPRATNKVIIININTVNKADQRTEKLVKELADLDAMLNPV